MRPEVEKVKLAGAVANGKLVSDDTAALLAQITGARVIELGGIGAIAEYLSPNNEVRLCEETRLYFVYRRHLLPKSTVIEINVDPRTLNYSKPYYDLVIIHGPAYLDKARMLSKDLIFDAQTGLFEQIKKEEKKEDAPDNTEVNQPKSEDVVDTKELE